MAMAALGLFVFELRTVPFQGMQEEKQYRFAYNSRVGKRPSWQFLGLSNDPITLSGTLCPEISGGKFSMMALEAMADSGKAWSFIGGEGTIYGMYVIESISKNKSEFFHDSAARKIDFTIKLTRVDESLSEMFGDISAQLDSLTDTVGTIGNNIADGITGLLS